MPALDAASHGRSQASIEHYCLAVDRVRYVGEPAAAVLACGGYSFTALDARERLQVSYRPLPLVIDPAVPLLHLALSGNIAQPGGNSERRSR